ncbi:MAG: Gfo/Idh/MocA family oxidoreductase [Planctomycetes bacterium]|nr:Gfo/Idh/MocA family oxidoreductase [Planctomycetota bacterium]
MATPAPVNVAFIGAGSICRARHIPGLLKIPGVKIAAVSNRSRQSGEAVAREFNIPNVEDDWHALLDRRDIDAIFIGTWPYMHREISVAALAAGKHVFCQARMAMDLADARRMLDAARARPELVNMICPPPTRMPFEPWVRRVIREGQLGTITCVELVSVGAANTNPNAVHWRERREMSGNQVMAMGIYAETLNAWVGPYDSLSAVTSIPLPVKRDAQGLAVEIKVPQVVTITGRLANGANAVELHTGLACDRGTPTDRLTIWGTSGTIRYCFGETIDFARAGEELRPADVPGGERRGWLVEEDFISAVRAVREGKAWAVSPDFAEGLGYMTKVEAVHASASTGRAVKLSDL